MSRRLPSRLPSQYPLNLSTPDSAAGTSAVTGVPPPVLSPQHTGALTMSVVSDSASGSDGSITPRRASISADSLTEGDIPGILDPGRLYKAYQQAQDEITALKLEIQMLKGEIAELKIRAITSELDAINSSTPVEGI
ncbi:hypothetical protein HYPSUDRAFT_219719 [Hypholoma sublateritium FD-334 SS-4]|uniref:Uncharacterized protein n=1 Tax=Hypholoma sublateritium (strain FD-334 SS-4) TaxID=945553 RepID=A0A0D2P6N4_HYPSF|nr:hypothetical protein HYPSUDRAFT_219719 [Hypholoma sublateritium FD-334 SS-4]